MPRMPQVSARELIAFLEKQGLERLRQSGSHMVLFRDSDRLCVTVPVHTGCDIGRGLVVRILKDAGYSVDDFLKLR